MSSGKKSSDVGGVKGLIQKATDFAVSTGTMLKEHSMVYAKKVYLYGGSLTFAIATTSMVVLMPLLFEIAREGQMLETERAQIKDLKSKGYSDRQLQELGFSESAIHTPSVAAAGALAGK